jgi:hypothetical protein
MIRLTERKSALTGELGDITPYEGAGYTSTEISVTLQDPRLKGGQWVNIPLLVKGQKRLRRLTMGIGPDEEQVQIAIQRAIERVNEGADLPSYMYDMEALKAAQERSSGFEPFYGKPKIAPVDPPYGSDLDAVLEIIPRGTVPPKAKEYQPFVHPEYHQKHRERKKPLVPLITPKELKKRMKALKKKKIYA